MFTFKVLASLVSLSAATLNVIEPQTLKNVYRNTDG